MPHRGDARGPGDGGTCELYCPHGAIDRTPASAQAFPDGLPVEGTAALVARLYLPAELRECVRLLHAGMLSTRFASS